MDISGKECARARESVSADLDCELHELDLRRLQAHLRVCADCSAWATRVRATTAQLREAPLEQTPVAALDPPRRRARRIGSILVVAPAAAVAASVVFFLGAAQHGLFGNPATTSTALRSTTTRNLRDTGSTYDRYRLPVLYHTFRAI